LARNILEIGVFKLKKRCIITPDCPRCGSKKTGYYLFVNNSSDVPKIISRKMGLGELVRFRNGFPDPNLPNLFCKDCDIEWRGNYKIELLSDEDIEKLKEKKGIDKSEIEEFKNYKKTAKNNRKDRRRQFFRSKTRSVIRAKK
jgi:hypothetical protein